MFTSFPFVDVPTFLTPNGKCYVTGFLIIFMRVTLLCVDLILNLVSNYAIMAINLLKVLGILIYGLTSINAFSFVFMYTYNKPALFKGESNNANKHYIYRD